LVANALAVNVVVAATPSLQVSKRHRRIDRHRRQRSDHRDGRRPSQLGGRGKRARAALGTDGKFFVDGVQLLPGPNTLTIVLNSMDGAPVTKT
jgi:hypothetical protein